MSTAVATKPSLTIKRRFNAAPSKVFAAWTQAEKKLAIATSTAGPAR